MNNNFELMKYRQGNIELELRVSASDNSLWLSKDQIGQLFNRDRSAISKHIKHIFDEGLDEKSNVHFLHIANSDKPVMFYSLTVILSVGYRIKSQNGLLLKEFFENYLKEKQIKNDIIIYNNGDIELTVNISPEEENVWLNANQISTLFDTSTQNVYMHIKNIYEEGEINNSVSKDFLPTQKEFSFLSSDGKQYTTTFYSLDVILAVGYRVKSKRAMEFRKWASNVLKKYLLKGYAIDNNRTLVTDENYLNLVYKVEKLDTRILKLENTSSIQNEQIFYDGNLFDARSFLKQLFEKAKRELLVVDPYLDIKALDYLKVKNNGVIVSVFTSSKSKLTKDDVRSFNKQYGNLNIKYIETFHDRFILIDDSKLYHLGTSLNYLGTKTFAIVKMDESLIVDFKTKLLSKLKE